MQTPKIFIEANGTSGQARHVIPHSPMVTVGSDPSNHIVLQGEGIVSLHALIMLDGSGLVLCDQGAPGGTFVNGLPVTEHELRKGDVVEMGNIKLIFRDEGVTPLPPPLPPEPPEPPPLPASPPIIVEPDEAPFTDDRRSLHALLAAVVIVILSGFGFLAWHLVNRTTVEDVPVGTESGNIAESEAESAKITNITSPTTSPKAEPNTVSMPSEPTTSAPPSSAPKSEQIPTSVSPAVAATPSGPLPLSARVWRLVNQSSPERGGLAQLPSTDGRLSKLDQTIENTAKQNAFARWQNSLTELQSHYRQALDRELRTATSLPDPDVALAAFRAEIDQLKSASFPQPIPADAPASLKRLRTTYLLEAAKHARTREMALGELYDGYCKGLAHYASDLSQDGRTDDAAAVRVLTRAIE